LRELKKEYIMKVYQGMKYNNIHTIDTKMFYFDNYQSSYLIDAGGSIVLVDCGQAAQWQEVTEAIERLDYSVDKIDWIFLTHAEHVDHSGNVGYIVKRNPDCKVVASSHGTLSLINPDVEFANRRRAFTSLDQAAKMGWQVKVPEKNMEIIGYGDDRDVELAGGEQLKITHHFGEDIQVGPDYILRCYFAPGHQPGHMIVEDPQNKALFVGDIPGNVFSDCGCHYTLNPSGSDIPANLKSLQLCLDLDPEVICMGHFGISDDVKGILGDAITIYSNLYNMGREYMESGRAEEIPTRFMEIMAPTIDKLARYRGGEVAAYAGGQHLPAQSKLFLELCKEYYFPELA